MREIAPVVPPKAYDTFTSFRYQFLVPAKLVPETSRVCYGFRYLFLPVPVAGTI